MGLFDRLGLGPRKTASLSAQDSIAGLLLGVVASDGEITKDEHKAFSNVIIRHTLFRAQTFAEFDSMLTRILRMLQREDWSDFAPRLAGAVPAELKPTVFALAVDLALTDSIVQPEEVATITHMRDLLGIDHGEAQGIVRVLAIKHGL